jgi:GNAT superfamily N-acetyltransferase
VRQARSFRFFVFPSTPVGRRLPSKAINVVTHPDFRRRGIGTRILRAALELAWTQDCYKVMLLTSRKGEATLRFYQQAGFEAGVKTGFVTRR